MSKVTDSKSRSKRSTKASAIAPATRLGPQQTVMALLESAALVERRLDTALSNICGISFSEYRLLQALNDAYEATATRVEVARQVGLTPSAVTRAFKPLEKMGLIRSTKSERDARQSLATLTDAGSELMDNAQGVVADQVASLPIGNLSGAALQQCRDDLLTGAGIGGRNR